MSDAMKTIIKAALSQLGNSCVDFFNEVSPPYCFVYVEMSLI